MTVEYELSSQQMSVSRPHSVTGSNRSVSAYSVASTALSSSKMRRPLPAATPLVAWNPEVNEERNKYLATPAAGPMYSKEFTTGDSRSRRATAPVPLDHRQGSHSSFSNEKRTQPVLRPLSASTSNSARSFRSKSAMDYSNGDPLVAQANDPYMTVYNSEFHKRSAPEAPNVRPPTQMGMSDQKFRDDTTYANEYSKKQPNPNVSLWSGGNNPHPSQAFMVWKYPTNKQRQPDEEAPTITNEQYDQAMRGRCQSTYQTDFMGFPQGYKPADASSSLRDPATEVQYTLDSLQRYSYQQPNQSDVLKIGTTRYSHSGADRHRLLVGGAPSISQVQLSAKHSTTYNRHYNETAPPACRAPKFPEKSSRSVKGKGPDTVAKLYAESRSEIENMDQRYAEPNSSATDYIRQGPSKIPEPRWITTPVPAPLPL